MPTDMTTIDTDRLAECEGKIDRSLRSFVEIGDSLLEIRDSRLYRGDHTTFSDYCQERWNITKSRANQLISASSLVRNLGSDALPASESVARELQRVGEGDVQDVWSRVCETAPVGPNGQGVVTARHVRETVASITTNTTPPPEHANLQDETGVEIPSSVMAEYETGIELRRLAAEVSMVSVKVRQLDGRRGMAMVNTQEIDRLFQQVREEIRFGAFYTVCPSCNGQNTDSGDCVTCRGRGYLNRRTHSMTPDEEATA